MSNARRPSGALLALIGALGVAGSAYLEWLKNSQGDDNPTAVEMAFSRLYDSDASAMAEMTPEPGMWDGSYWESIALALGIVGALGVIGAVLRLRSVLWLGFLVGLATLVLFVVFTFMAADEAGLDPGVSDLLMGFWLAVAGLVVLAIGIFTMGGKPTAEAPPEEESAPAASDDSEDLFKGTTDA